MLWAAGMAWEGSEEQDQAEESELCRTSDRSTGKQFLCCSHCSAIAAPLKSTEKSMASALLPGSLLSAATTFRWEVREIRKQLGAQGFPCLR